MEMKKKEFRVQKKQVITVSILILLIILISIIELMQSINKNKTQISPELARAMTYGELTTKDEETQSEYVRFSSYFARDLDSDGYAEKVKGTCKEVEGEDTLYMSLNVLGNGYLKDGKIEIESNNIYFKTALVDDEIISGNYISENTKEINLKEVTAGTQKLIFGQVRTGDYRYTTTKKDALGKDTNKLSGINKIKLTGVHVTNEGVETKIEKEIEIPVDWYSTTKAEIPYTYGANKEKNKYQNYNTESIVDEENQEVNLEFKITSQESNNKLLLKKSTIEGTIPELEGYKATNVEITGENVQYTYDQETGNFTAYREAQIGEDGVVTKEAYTSSYNTARYSEYKLKVTYPLAAYENSSENGTIVLNIPVKATFEGYNNPNEEFNNPYVSNVAEDVISVTYERGGGDVISYDVQVGTWVSNPYNVYVISKENAVGYYNQIEEATKDTYEVRWYVARGNSGEISNVQLREQDNNYTDKFLKTDGTYEDMLKYSKNIGIYFTTPGAMFGDDGWIRVYNDETDQLIHEFTKADWESYTKENPYYYDQPVAHIRIETSSADRVSSFTATNIKELDNELLTTDKTREEFDKLSKINSYLSGYAKLSENEEYQKLKDDIGIANYDEPISMAQINNVTPITLSTQETTNVKITIGTVNLGYNVILWKNGTFLLKFPEEVLLAEINNVTINNGNVEILGYDIYEQDGNYYLKILTENENPENYTITVDADITPDPRKLSATRDIELYAYNEECNNYKEGLRAEDIYDINANGNTTDLVDYSKKSISFVGPTSLLTTETGSDYNDEGEEVKTTIAPQVAIIDKAQNNRTAKISVQILNNYSGNISGVVVVGKTPFEGNKSQILEKDLGSTFTASMTGPIQLPEKLQGIATVYYSENETVNNNISDASNNWKTESEVTDFSKIRTYAIDLGDYVIAKGEEYICTYEIEVPQEVNYNDVTYSTHAVYFYLETDEGKLRDQTETNKLGFMIARKYNLELTKTQKGNDYLVEGATYKVTEEGTNNSKIAITNAEGLLTIKDLYAERIYEIQEIKSPQGYELNEDVIKFRTKIDENGNIQAEKIDGESKTDFIVNDKIISITVEDVPLSTLNILKQDTNGTAIEDIRFEITGKGYQNRAMITNSKGIATIRELYPNEEYTIKEVKADGYYIADGELKFVIEQAGENYNLRVIEDTLNVLELMSGRTENNLASFQIKLQNEKIPTYNLEILKTDKDTDEPLSNAQFTLKSLDSNDEKYYTTNESGIIDVEELYQYVDGKNILGEYELTEVVAPEGYITDTNIYRFRCEEIDGILQLEFLTENTFEYTIENGTIKVNFKNAPIFTLYKKDGETQEPLPNTKFAIYKIDEERNEYPAYDVKGNLVGEQTEINGQTYQVITTDENGEISLNLPQGAYKVVEIEALEEYELLENIEDRTYYFGIDETVQATKEWSNEMFADISKGIGLDSSSDNNFIIANTDNKDVHIDESETNTSENINISFADECGDGIIVRKYNKNKKIEWTRVIAGEAEDISYNVVYKDENNIIILMGTKSSQLYLYDQYSKSLITDTEITQNSYYNPVIIKMDGEGNVVDSVCIKGQITHTDNAMRASEINDDNLFAITLFYNQNTNIEISSTDTISNQDLILQSGENGNNVAIIYFNEDLKVKWGKNVTRLINNNPSGGIEITDNGEVIFAGIIGNTYTISADETVNKEEINLVPKGSFDHIYIKYNSEGKIEAAKNFGGTGRDDVEDIYLDDDGGYIVTGQSRASIVIPSEETVKNEEIVIELPQNMSYYGVAVKFTRDFKVEWVVSYDTMTNFTNVIKYKDDYFITGSKGFGICEIPADKTSNNEAITLENYLGSIFLSINNEGKFNWMLNVTSNGTLGGSSLYPINIGDEFLVESSRDIRRVYQKVVLPEVPDIQEITVDNYKKQYNIWTYVNGEGGHISGEYEDPYEKVTIYKDSIKDIIVTPNEGYAVNKIIINGEEISFTTREDGTVILDKFTDMIEDKEVEVTFIPKEYVFTINKVNEKGEKLQGAEFEVTSRITDDPSIGENAVGELIQMGEEDYYEFVQEGDKYKPTNLDVNDSVAMSGILIDLSSAKDLYKITINAEMNAGDNYNDNAVAYVNDMSNYDQQWIFDLTGKKEAQDYTLIVQGGDMYALTLGYANMDGNTNDEFVINSIKVEQTEYTQKVTTDANGEIKLTFPAGDYVIKETKAPEGYLLNEEEIPFTIGGESNSLNIVNKEGAKVKVHHYKDGTEEKLSEDETLTGEIGANYTTSPKTDIEGYEVVVEKLPSNASGEYTEDVQEVNYYYKQIPAKLIVNHYIEGTEEIVPGSENEQINEEREKGTEYTTTPAQNIDPKYELVEMPSNSTGTLTENETVVTYYYRVKDSAGVIVHHIDTDTKEQIAPDVVIPSNGIGKYGDSYTTEVSSEIPINYKYATRTDNWEGTMIDKLTEVTYEYKMVDPTITNKIEKTATQEITKIDDVVTYNITYSANVEDYIGKAQITIVDVLPYAIDTSKSILNGGTYNPDTNTITWQEVVNGIDTYANPESGNIEINKTIKVVYMNLDTTKETIENNVSGKVKLLTSEKTSEEVTDTATTDTKIMTNVIVKYLEKDDTPNDNSDNKVVAPEETIEGYIGKEYTTQQKDVPGYTFIESTDNTEGTMTKDPIEVIYYYAQNTKVVVKYLEKDDTPGDNTDNKVLAAAETIEGYEGKDYETEQKDINNYTFVESTNNTEGTMTKDIIEVIYYYLQNTKATVQHIDRETGEILKEETEDGKVGDLFETHAEDFEGYILVESPEEPNIIMDETGEQVVRYYYAHVSAGVIEKHIDDITGELLYSEEHQGNEGDSYNIPSKTFEGYDLVTEDKEGNSRLPDNAEGTMKRDEVIEVKYYYIKKAKVVIKYLEEDDTPEDTTDNKVLAEEETIEGHENDSYETESKDIKDYNLVGIPENAKGTMTITKNQDGTYNTEIEVIYYYKKQAGGVIENHIDITTNEKLATEEHTGNVGDEYDIPSREFEGYDLVIDKLPTNAKGEMTEGPIEVNYYYIKQAKVEVEYIDKQTGEKLDEDELKGHIGDSYETEEKNFDNYELIEIPDNTMGEMTEDTIVVKYYYKRKTEVEVHYVEKNTNHQLAESDNIEGYVGDEYKTQSKDITYYKLVGQTENTEGTMERDKITVIYYYEKQVFNLSVDKWVSNVSVNGINQGGRNINSKDEIYKVDIHRSKTETANIKITYKIRVTNKGEIEGTAGEIVEIIPEGYSYYQEDNKVQWEERNGTLITDALKNETIKIGEYKEIEIVLRWDKGEDNFGQKDNFVIIGKMNNPAGYEDISKEDNKSKSSMIITVATGLDRNDRIAIIGIVQIVLVITIGLLFSYKKKEKK